MDIVVLSETFGTCRIAIGPLDRIARFEIKSNKQVNTATGREGLADSFG
ncbi:MAG TPA: hypothetical protein VH352_07780 [Pseudonocardiaceae bacterium]|jgi:hypothetical protein|nr:hypothetical protein [Pseudonocardiaceae bacterium]